LNFQVCIDWVNAGFKTIHLNAHTGQIAISFMQSYFPSEQIEHEGRRRRVVTRRVVVEFGRAESILRFTSHLPGCGGGWRAKTENILGLHPKSTPFWSVLAYSLNYFSCASLF
jgi:hypothetical protein